MIPPKVFETGRSSYRYMYCDSIAANGSDLRCERKHNAGAIGILTDDAETDPGHCEGASTQAAATKAGLQHYGDPHSFEFSCYR